jgi:hypothetical protein
VCAQQWARRVASHQWAISHAAQHARRCRLQRGVVALCAAASAVEIESGQVDGVRHRVQEDGVRHRVPTPLAAAAWEPRAGNGIGKDGFGSDRIGRQAAALIRHRCEAVATLAREQATALHDAPAAPSSPSRPEYYGAQLSPTTPMPRTRRGEVCAVVPFDSPAAASPRIDCSLTLASAPREEGWSALVATEGYGSPQPAQIVERPTPPSRRETELEAEVAAAKAELLAMR